jgi:hypothetical protein
MSLTLPLSRSTLFFDGLARKYQWPSFLMVRAEAVAKDVKAFPPGISDRGLRLVEDEPEFGHHTTRPRQCIGRMPAAENDKVSGAGGSHRRALAEPYVTLSRHTAPIVRPHPKSKAQ